MCRACEIQVATIQIQNIQITNEYPTIGCDMIICVHNAYDVKQSEKLPLQEISSALPTTGRCEPTRVPCKQHYIHLGSRNKRLKHTMSSKSTNSYDNIMMKLTCIINIILRAYHAFNCHVFTSVRFLSIFHTYSYHQFYTNYTQIYVYITIRLIVYYYILYCVLLPPFSLGFLPSSVRLFLRLKCYILLFVVV